ncbi:MULTISPECIES: YitT family protein [Aurantimicrobium]|uniref:YitT family protein n=1 Tax=Aurantimicrobium minutum TaxID=708131 RepID=A0A173LV30_9MICO|nr:MULTISPECIES: YitT family protein [Aurantimicrobium]BAU98795.1 Uncharacterized protein AUMI_12530 [Aurantimicrobium minutum]BDU11171.1 membrane protein [Aurantimicrobium sp. INA4]
MHNTSVDDSRTTNAQSHSLLDDIVGISASALLASVGVFLMDSGHVVTGGIAGLALLISYATPLSFSVVWILASIPFLPLAVWKKGWNFTLRSLVAIVLVSLFTQLTAMNLGPLDIDPLFGAVVGNVVASIGVLGLFRHRSSLGGFNVVALIAQEQYGWRAGYVQLVIDLAIVAGAFFVASPVIVLYSAVGAFVFNFILALNHREGRYNG